MTFVCLTIKGTCVINVLTCGWESGAINVLISFWGSIVTNVPILIKRFLCVTFVNRISRVRFVTSVWVVGLGRCAMCALIVFKVIIVIVV